MNPEPNNTEPEQGEAPQTQSMPQYPSPSQGFAADNRPKNTASASSPNTRDVAPFGLGGTLNDLPTPVVHALSVRGVEYTMMTLCLWMCAGALMWALLAVANGQSSFSILAFPISLMLVTLPIFAFFFLRLKKAEVANPELRFDASKRRLSQFTQIIAFSTCLFNVIAFVYMVMTNISGEGSISIGKAFLNLVVVLAIAGGIFAYYWNDEHRTAKQRY